MNTSSNIKDMASHYFIIDDDDDDQELMKEAFDEIDASVICDSASNGEDGLKILKSGLLQRPKLIFLDLNMPRMDGRQFLASLKEDIGLKNIPVIIYSTSSEASEIKILMDMGAARFLIKSNNYNDLVLKLKEIIFKTVSA